MHRPIWVPLSEDLESVGTALVKYELIMIIIIIIAKKMKIVTPFATI